jgi:hypothetical protein
MPASAALVAFIKIGSDTIVTPLEIFDIPTTIKRTQNNFNRLHIKEKNALIWLRSWTVCVQFNSPGAFKSMAAKMPFS